MSKQATTTIDLAEQIGSLERELQQLLVEQERIPGGLRAAAEAADAEQLVTLRRRADEIPARVFAMHAKKLRLEIAQIEAQLPDAEVERHEANQALDAAAKEYEAAREKLNKARSWAGNVDTHRRSLQVDLQERRRMLAALIDDAGRDRGPVMRYAVGRSA